MAGGVFLSCESCFGRSRSPPSRTGFAATPPGITRDFLLRHLGYFQSHLGTQDIETKQYTDSQNQQKSRNQC